ncbi:MAG: hypothetical protein MUE46_20490, partial [Xanthomonadales bacterium]|nr:hypothetical protein [Xanthomonadales bacterium]
MTPTLLRIGGVHAARAAHPARGQRIRLADRHGWLTRFPYGSVWDWRPRRSIRYRMDHSSRRRHELMEATLPRPRLTAADWEIATLDLIA